MAKYRLLTMEELEELENEFIEYLVLNGIAGDDWKAINEAQPENARKIVNLFSDVVFEGIMRKAQFLELREKKKLKVLHCLKDRFVLIGLDASAIEKANFLDVNYLQQSMDDPPTDLRLFTNEIKYELAREEEIFKMTEHGFSITDEKLFKALCLVFPSE